MLIFSVLFLLAFLGKQTVVKAQTAYDSCVTSSDVKKIIDEINGYRTDHRVPLLKENDKLKIEGNDLTSFSPKKGGKDNNYEADNFYELQANDEVGLELWKTIIKKWYDVSSSYNYDSPSTPPTGSESFIRLTYKKTGDVNCFHCKPKSGDAGAAQALVCRFKPSPDLDKISSNELKENVCPNGGCSSLESAADEVFAETEKQPASEPETQDENKLYRPKFTKFERKIRLSLLIVCIFVLIVTILGFVAVVLVVFKVVTTGKR